MNLYDNYMEQIPDYYPAMYRDGFKPEQILMAKRRQMQEERETAMPTNIHITSEVKTK